MLKPTLLAKTQAPANYVAIAAGVTGGAIQSSTASLGDLLTRLIIIPATTGAGLVTLIDGTGGSAVSIPIFIAGTLADLSPIVIELGIVSQVAGGWHITTGSNVSVLAVGLFS